VSVKGCHVVMGIFFSFHMGGKISIGSGFVASIIFARLRLAFEFASEGNCFLSLFGRA
jgi:hypothetical protein